LKQIRDNGEITHSDCNVDSFLQQHRRSEQKGNHLRQVKCLFAQIYSIEKNVARTVNQSRED